MASWAARTGDFNVSPQALWLARRRRIHMGFDLFEEINNVVDFVDKGVQGLGNVVAEVISEVAQIVVNVVKVVLETVGAVFGVVPWENVRESLGKIARSVGHVLVLTNPTRFTYEWLKSSRLTSHSLNELDKFTGGMLTTAVNVSDVAFRAMRGDPISKMELVQNALLILQIAITVATAGVAAAPAALFTQTVVGGIAREVCKKQTDKDTCKVLVTAASIAAGAYATGAQELSKVPMRIIDERIRETATRALVAKCRDEKWIGDRECAIVGRMVVDYLSLPPETDWNQYLAETSARLGVALIIEQLYPPKSPERQAIINVVTQLPPEQRALQLEPARSSGAFLLLTAAAVGGLFLIAEGV